MRVTAGWTARVGMVINAVREGWRLSDRMFPGLTGLLVDERTGVRTGRRGELVGGTEQGRPEGSSGDARWSRQDRRVLGTGCKCGSELRQRVADDQDAPSEQGEFGARIIANRDVEDQVQLVEPAFQAGRRRVQGCPERVEWGNGAPSRGGSGSSGSSACHAPERQPAVHLAGRVLRPRGNGRVPGASVPEAMAVGTDRRDVHGEPVFALQWVNFHGTASRPSRPPQSWSHPIGNLSRTARTCSSARRNWCDAPR